MIFAAIALAAAQVVVPSGQGMSVDQRVAALARQEARVRDRIDSVIFDDPGMRAELRRVGFATGCTTVAAAGKEVLGRHAEALEAEIAQAIRKVIPAERLAEARPISFLAMPLLLYRRRVDDELERNAAAALSNARDDMRRTFLARSSAIPSSSNPADNQVLPKPDVAAALGQKGAWDLDNPAHVAFACAEHLISPRLRPTITTGALRQ